MILGINQVQQTGSFLTLVSLFTQADKNNTANKLVPSVNARKKDTREEFPEDIFFQIYRVHNLSL